MSLKKAAILAIIASIIVTFTVWVIGAVTTPKIPDGTSTQEVVLVNWEQVVYHTYIPENDLTRKDR